MASEFRVDYTTSAKTEDLYGEICYDGQILCRLIKTDGAKAEVEIEFFFDQYVTEREADRRFPLRAFLAVVNEVEAELTRWFNNLRDSDHS